MQKLILMSVLIATFVIPVMVERRDAAEIGFRAVLRMVLLFIAAWVVGLTVIYPRLF